MRGQRKAISWSHEASRKGRRGVIGATEVAREKYARVVRYKGVECVYVVTGVALSQVLSNPMGVCYSHSCISLPVSVAFLSTEYLITMNLSTKDICVIKQAW